MNKVLLTVALCLGSGVRAGLAANACFSNGTCAVTLPCAWSRPETWISCGGGVPQSDDSWTVVPGDVVIYETGGVTTGAMTVGGTLLFDESLAGRDGDGFRSLIIRSGPGDEVTVHAGGVLRLRKGDRIRFNTTAGGATVWIANGGALDAQGSVHQTTIGAVTNLPADRNHPTCGTTTGRKLVITPSSGIEFAQAKRRVVFQSGRARNRQYEIIDVTGGSFTVCTDLDDRLSGDPVAAGDGQRLTPHAGTIGTFPSPRHSTPTTSTAVPAAGDQIAIVQDVWFDLSAGNAGYRIFGTTAGQATFPILKAVNFNRIGTTDLLASGLDFMVEAAGQPVADVSYVNLHDYNTNFGLIYRGAQNVKVEWSAFHDAGPAAGDAVAVLQFLDSDFGIPVVGAEISDNVFYRVHGNSISINGADSIDFATGVKIRRNLLYDSCDTPTGECNGIEMDACRMCEVSHNVLYNLCNGQNSSGSMLEWKGNVPNDGSAVHDNWAVNGCGDGFGLGYDLGGVDTGQKVGVTHNYVSHVKGNGGRGGRYYSNLIKNVGMDSAGLSGVLFNPVVAMGNVLVGNDDAVAVGEACDEVAPPVPDNGCSRYGIWLGKLGHINRSPVTIRDNLIVQLDAIYTRTGILFETDFNSPDFDAAIEHVTCDFRGGWAPCVSIEQSLVPATPIAIVVNDIAQTHAYEAPIVICTSTPGITETLGNLYSTLAPLPTDSGGEVGPYCSNSGALTRPPDLEYRDRLGLDFNFLATAPGQTAGGSPPGSPIGVRAFRFDRDRINSLWGGVLPFDGQMPVDIANAPNLDTDGDGVIDLHDNCVDTPNPSQFDPDDDGFPTCNGDCDDTNPAVHPGHPEVCDGLDNNCDASIDEGLTQTTTCGIGECQRTVASCVDGVPQVCAPGSPRPEVCDGIDNDCNGLVDDDGAGVDSDADSIRNACDNCPLTRNPDQADLDGDLQGDVCDLDDGLIIVTLPDRFNVAWQQEAGFDSFNEYRGDLGVLKATGIYTQDPATVPLALRNCHLTAPTIPDGPDPGVGKAVFYLVTGVAGGVEGSLGRNSDGMERTNSNPCP